MKTIKLRTVMRQIIQEKTKEVKTIKESIAKMKMQRQLMDGAKRVIAREMIERGKIKEK